MGTRTFTRDELEELGLPDEDEADDGVIVHIEHHVEPRDWGTGHDLVFRAPDDGKLWQVRFYSPATEHQECDTWGYYDRPAKVKAVEVEPYEVTVTKYRPIAEAVTV